MRATFTDEQQHLSETARDLAARGREHARALLEGGDLEEEPTRSLFTGFAGLAVPEDAGGMGGTLVDLAIVVHELARSVTPTPFVTHAMAVQVATSAGLDVAEAARGDERWALADVGPRLEGSRLTGTAEVVRDGRSCDAVVVVDPEERVAVAVPSERRDRDSLDPTRPLADLVLDGDVVGSGDGASAGLRRATAVLAADLVGVGRGAVDLAAEYARVREQFGQPIGRFQGVAHQLADAFTGVELAWSLALYACWAVADDAPDAAEAVHAAKQRAGEAAIHAAERCTQVHGGIGITWEADPHLYLRRALADDAWLGNAREHRQALGASVLAR